MIIKQNREFLETYLKDASNYSGSAEILFIPESIDEIDDAFREIKSLGIPLTVSGGGTGLSGGRVPESGAVLSMEKLDSIISIDYNERTVRMQPGVILSHLEEILETNAYFYPPNPTENNSTLGGNVATNASGSRTFKYGPTRNWITGLKLLLPDGDNLTIKRGKKHSDNYELSFFTENGKLHKIILPEISMPSVKNAAGYYIKKDMDLIDLFIGDEGTLGIIKEIEVSFLESPEKILGGIVFFDDHDKLISFVDEVRFKSYQSNSLDYRMVDTLCCRLIEFYDENSLKLLSDTYPQIPENTLGAIWFEQEHAPGNEDKLLSEWWLTILKYTNLANSSWIAQNDNEHRRLAEFRHKLPLLINEIVSNRGQIKIGTDLAVPDQHLKEFYDFIRKNLAAISVDYAVWGHIGNNHFHANLLVKNEEEKRLAHQFYDSAVEFVLKRGGTISAEHGVGKLKKKYLRAMYGESDYLKMRALKEYFDPEYLLGRGNLFDYPTCK